MIKFISIFFVFACGAGVAWASGDVSQFVFTTNSQTIKPNEVSGAITIQAQNTNGDYATSTQTICIELASISDTGEFSSNNTSWSSVKILTMNKGWANRNFYYKDSTAGAYELSLKISLKPEGKPACASWPKEEWEIKWNIKQSIIVSSDSASSSSQSFSSASSVANSGSGSIIWPDEQQIYANAGKDKTGIAGADVLFEGKALGIKKEPLSNARYLWNFGDGASGEGKNIKHTYKYPGNYIAVLDVSSGQYSVSDRTNVKIAANELIISEAGDKFIKLKNKSGIILDISGWFLMGGGVLFKFPESSFVSANSDLIISSDVSKIKLGNLVGAVDLLYSNGSVAFSYQNKKETKSQTVMSVTAVSSSSQTDKITQIIQPPKKPEPTTVVGSGTTTQLANVIYSSGENKDGKSYKKWLFLSVIIGLFSGGALFFVRRKSLS